MMSGIISNSIRKVLRTPHSSAHISRRFLSLHEYQSQRILKDYGLPIAKGDVATDAASAVNVAKALGCDNFVIKAQVLAGGRGKGHFTSGLQGGVKVCETAEQVGEYASQMIGSKLITKQTGEAGKPCDTVYIVERLFPEKEYYVAILLDRGAANPVIVASAEGGMDIETVAATNPSAIIKSVVDINRGVTAQQADLIAHKLGFSGHQASQASNTIRKLYQIFTEKDASLVEINPMAVLNTGDVLCMDAKVSVDDNANFRQKDLFDMRDYSQEDEREVQASKFDLNYVGLDGSIGCLVNGAGLAMATMDIIKLHKGEPANFLDVGGSATTEQITEAFRIISADPRVKSIFVNIFGGIMRGDIVAQGVVEACKTLELRLPVVVRLQGTNAERGSQIIADSGLKIIAENDFDTAARKAVECSQ